MPLFAFSVFGYLGLLVVAVSIVVLLYSTFHPEGRRRPGGYLDGDEPRPPEEDERSQE